MAVTLCVSVHTGAHISRNVTASDTQIVVENWLVETFSGTRQQQSQREKKRERGREGGRVSPLLSCSVVLTSTGEGRPVSHTY